MHEVKFHTDVYLPASLEAECLTVLVRMDGRYRISNHARERMAQRGITLPRQLPFMQGQVVEATFEDGVLQRFLFRFRSPTCTRTDLIVSYDVSGCVATCYANRTAYTHRSMDRSVYATTLDAIAA